MKEVVEFIKQHFTLHIFILFLISSSFLYYDSKEYSKRSLDYEAKSAKFLAIFSIAISFILFIIAKILP